MILLALEENGLSGIIHVEQDQWRNFSLSGLFHLKRQFGIELALQQIMLFQPNKYVGSDPIHISWSKWE